jgi:beta-1,4-N-acetylglucosaminyltransferase
MSPPRKTVFVTVGTTLFEALIQATTTEEALEWMYIKGYTHLIIQYGKGAKPSLPERSGDSNNLSIEVYSFKPSLQPDMEQADLVISHAGAGTVMEALRMKKRRLVVVINTILMDNHQTEIANAMGDRQHLFVVDDPVKLHSIDTWDQFEIFEATFYAGGDEYDFPRILNNFFGFHSKEE